MKNNTNGMSDRDLIRSTITKLLGQGCTYADRRKGGKIRYKWIIDYGRAVDMKSLQKDVDKLGVSCSYSIGYINKPTRWKPMGRRRTNDVVLTV